MDADASAAVDVVADVSRRRRWAAHTVSAEPPATSAPPASASAEDAPVFGRSTTSGGSSSVVTFAGTVGTDPGRPTVTEVPGGSAVPGRPTVVVLGPPPSRAVVAVVCRTVVAVVWRTVVAVVW